jgi:DNA invertase Pin-like site-specific DNA recombinase
MLVPYVRQSRSKERTISIDEQKRAIEGWAEGVGVKLSPFVVEQGVSGNKPWRQRELGDVIARCERGEAEGVVVGWQDRLSRENGAGTAEVWEALERAGARLVAVNDGIDTSTGDQEMLFTIRAAIARDQWKRFRKNWSDARRNAVARGIHPCRRDKPPYGYRVGPDRKLVPEPAEAKVVRGVFERRGRGESWEEICRWLDSIGAETRNGVGWQHRTVSRIVNNPVYLGEARHGEFVNPDAHEPLVTRGEWVAAQTKQRGRLTRGTEGARLSGLVFCASCGSRMSPDIPHRYRCLNRNCDAKATARMGALDSHVVDEFLEHYEEQVGELSSKRGGDEEPSTVPLERALERANEEMRILLADTESLAVLGSAARTELLLNAQRRVDDAQAALDSALAGDQRRRWASEAIQPEWLSDHFQPEGETDTTISEQRKLLSAGIDCVTVSRGSGPIAERTVISFYE